MQSMQRILRSMTAVAMVLGVLASAVPASALTMPSNMLSGRWTSYGNASTMSVNSLGSVHVLTSSVTRNDYVAMDVPFVWTSGRVAVFTAYTAVDSLRTGREAGDITGKPYLYGYAMDADNEILGYLQGQDMLFNGTTGRWDVSSGAFTVPEGTKQIRFFVKQARRAGSVHNGTKAYVFKPQLFQLGAMVQARDVINEVTRLTPAASTVPAASTPTTPTQPTTPPSTNPCTDGRSLRFVTVQVDSAVYADDADADTTSEYWRLWMANLTSWDFSRFGQDASYAIGAESDASINASICAKSGDQLLINGLFNQDDGTMYLVRREGTAPVESIAHVQITNVDLSCATRSNGGTGYDMVCTVR